MSNTRQKIKQFIISGSFKTPIDYLRSKGIKVGTGCIISPCHLSAKEGYLIEIGDYCRIAKDCEFFTHGGIVSLQILKNDPKLDYFGKIKIGNYVSIGEGAKIMAGVTIGDNVIIGAGSVVTKSVPAGYMVAGNPIKCIGYTEDWYNSLKEKYDLRSGQMSDSEKEVFLKSLPEDKFVKKPNVKPKG